MKTKIYLAFLMLVAAFNSCDKPVLTEENQPVSLRTRSVNNNITIMEGNYPNRDIRLSPNQIVVRLDANLAEPSLKAIKDEIFVQDFETCSCGDTNIQLWTIDTDQIAIEGAVSSINRNGGKGVEGDRHFTMTMQAMPPFNPKNKGANSEPFIKNTDAAVNIAVIDTGLDFSSDLFLGTSPFLYNTDGIPNCYPTPAGWSFVNDSKYVMDENGHGTYVTKMITDKLAEKGVDFTILPLKVFDRYGNGSYWDIVCALGYIKEVQKNGGSISIVNASFGGSMPQVAENQIFKGLIKDLSSTTLIITSAGNHGLDNDNREKAHFLSSYDSPNILAVGGYAGSGNIIRMDEYSNYGQISIDLAAPFHYNFRWQGGIANLSGTSYAAAYTSNLAAQIVALRGMKNPAKLKMAIFGNTFDASGLDNMVNENRALRMN